MRINRADKGKAVPITEMQSGQPFVYNNNLPGDIFMLCSHNISTLGMAHYVVVVNLRTGFIQYSCKTDAVVPVKAEITETEAI